MEDKIIDRLLAITGGAMLLNSKQLAKVLGQHPTTISELKNSRELGIPVVGGTGKRDMFSVVAVARYLLGQVEPQQAPPEPTQSSHNKRTVKKVGNGLPTMAQIRSMALKHFTTTLEEEAEKSLEVATFIKRMVKMEELDSELTKNNEPSKTINSLKL